MRTGEQPSSLTRQLTSEAAGGNRLKRLLKTVFLSCAVWISGAALLGGNAFADTPVRIQVNDQLIQFTEAAPFIDSSGQTLVPLRPVFEAMGYKLGWNPDSKDGQMNIVVQDDKKKTIVLKTGVAEALLNGKSVKLDAGAQLRQGTVYVPLRVISETLGYVVQWDNDNSIAIIGEDGKYHAPAAYYAKTMAAQAASAAAVQPVDTAGQVIQTAKSLLGIRYVWGGETPSGFDCSGFVNYVFGQYGIDLPRTSRGMYDGAGQPVSELKTGDLVFFNTTGARASHVGIYLGDGQFVSATTSRGTRIDSLYSSYWGPKYIGAKRIL